MSLRTNFSTSNIIALENQYNVKFNKDLEIRENNYKPQLGNKYGLPGVNYIKARWITDFVKNNSDFNFNFNLFNKEKELDYDTQLQNSLVNFVANTPLVVNIKINSFEKNQYGSYNFYVDQHLDPSSIEESIITGNYLVDSEGLPIDSSTNSPGVNGNYITTNNFNDLIDVTYNPASSALVVTPLNNSIVSLKIKVTANEPNNQNTYIYTLTFELVIY